MRTGYIYAIQCKCHPEEGIRYVGQTVKSIASREYHHKWVTRSPESRSYNSHLSNWIRKHGAENVEVFELDRCSEAEVDELEKLWIKRFRGSEYRLVNILEGGSQPRGHKRPEHSKLMSGESNPMYGQDRREIMAHARRFQGPPSEATKKIWREQRKGEGNARSVLTDEAVRRLREQPKRYGLFSEWAREYEVSPQTIYLAYYRKTWKHVE